MTVLGLAAALVGLAAGASGERQKQQKQEAEKNQERVAEPLRPTDELLEQFVEQALAEDEVVRSHELVVNVLDAAVTLYGNVDTTHERERAGAVAADVSGVAQVDNQIEVDKQLLPDMPSDRAIREAILEALTEEQRSADVEVEVEDGLATLTGTVSSRGQSRELSELAFRAGASLVRNELKVEP